MKRTIIIATLLINVVAFSQDDTATNSALEKLQKLEQMMSKNGSIDPLKAIKNAEYAKETYLKQENPATSVAEKTKGGPQISFSQSTFNLGTISQAKVASQKFIFTNTGNETLFITDVVADCSCTSPSWTKDDIPPGGKGYVTAAYDPKDDMGKFQKTITVLHNVGKGYSFLEITGFVAPKL